MHTLTTTATKIRRQTLSIAYRNNFALDMSNSKKRSAKSKSDSKKDQTEESKWKKNLKKIQVSEKKEKLTSRGCVYEQSSMFLFAIPK